MKRNNTVLAIVLASLLTASVANADAYLRIKCSDENEGADVFINGKEVGTCPVDAPAPAGMVTVRARKLVGSEYEKVFIKEVRVIDNVPQRLEIILSQQQLTAEAVRSREVAEARKQLQAAESGNVEAMKKIADYYAKGYGVEKSPAKAQEWRDKVDATVALNQLRAAESGNIEAMKKIVEYYTTGFGVGKNPAKAQEWRDKIAAAEKLQETVKTKNLEILANAGDISAMKELQSRYILGIGTEKNYAKGMEWEAKHKESMRKKELQMQLDNQRAAAQKLVEEKEQELNDVEFSFWVKNAVVAILEEKDSEAPTKTILIIGLPLYSAFDLVTLPVKGSTYFTKKRSLDSAKEKLERISSWGNPSSMIARSAKNAETPNDNNSLLAKVNN